MLKTILVALLLIVATGQAPNPPVFVTLWFDTEDYILPQDDDATKRLAEMLTEQGITATFKIVGEKARVLEQRGRRDVIAALRRHDIGYHSNTHSQQPTIAVYLQNAGWDDGRAEFSRREAQGARDVERIIGVAPIAYGQPGSAWAPQTYPALRDMHIRMYLDEADHVGIDDQPFYYGGMLNVFKMRSNLVRMELKGGDSLANGKAAFTRAYDKLRQQGGGTISIYYHPNEWVHEEFWDAVNFSRGANPPRPEWKLPRTRPAAETEQAFRDFDQFLRFMKGQPGVRFASASELLRIYADRSATQGFGREELVRFARFVQNEITFQRMNGYAVSAADVFGVLTDAMASFVAAGALPPGTSRTSLLDGPARPYIAAAGGAASARFSWTAFAQAIRDTSEYCRTFHRIPDEIWIGSESIAPADYLAMLGRTFEEVTGGTTPSEVPRREGHFTVDRYVAADSPDLWNWVIFPQGFHAPRIMELARLQAWTLKPAMLQR